jgi:hypothetical protein
MPAAGARPSGNERKLPGDRPASIAETHANRRTSWCGGFFVERQEGRQTAPHPALSPVS